MSVQRLALLLLVSLPAVAIAQKKARLEWMAAPPAFPAGARMAVVSGDPGKEGPFTIRLKMPSGYRIAPHYHPTDEHLVVKKGTFLVGMGDSVVRKSMTRMTVGKEGDVKANMHHYGMAKGRTTVEINSTGPFAMTYVNASDDPQSNAKMKAK